MYCRTGRRSAEASHKLADMGYTNVFDFGGIVDWPYLTIAGPAQTGVGCVIGNY
jgi:rhodanese-related sulfurtransferase